MKKAKLLVTTSRTDDLHCISCGKNLNDTTVCYTINSVQIVTIPLCAECLKKASLLLENANKNRAEFS